MAAKAIAPAATNARNLLINISPVCVCGRVMQPPAWGWPKDFLGIQRPIPFRLNIYALSSVRVST